MEMIVSVLSFVCIMLLIDKRNLLKEIDFLEAKVECLEADLYDRECKDTIASVDNAILTKGQKDS